LLGVGGLAKGSRLLSAPSNFFKMFRLFDLAEFSQMKRVYVKRSFACHLIAVFEPGAHR
jgi:hypothetical protein